MHLREGPRTSQARPGPGGRGAPGRRLCRPAGLRPRVLSPPGTGGRGFGREEPAQPGALVGALGKKGGLEGLVASRRRYTHTHRRPWPPGPRKRWEKTELPGHGLPGPLLPCPAHQPSLLPGGRDPQPATPWGDLATRPRAAASRAREPWARGPLVAVVDRNLGVPRRGPESCLSAPPGTPAAPHSVRTPNNPAWGAARRGGPGAAPVCALQPRKAQLSEFPRFICYARGSGWRTETRRTCQSFR